MEGDNLVRISRDELKRVQEADRVAMKLRRRNHDLGSGLSKVSKLSLEISKDLAAVSEKLERLASGIASMELDEIDPIEAKVLVRDDVKTCSRCGAVLTGEEAPRTSKHIRYTGKRPR